METVVRADVKCPKCKTYRFPDDFLNEKNRVLKTCQVCRNVGKKSREKNKCQHGKQINYCLECQGSGMCPHNKRKHRCQECLGASICQHNKQKSRCRDCCGSEICSHNKRKRNCQICDPIGHLSHNVRTAVRGALKATKSKRSIEYLGCSIEEFKQHIEKQFKEGMTWETHGDWHIDHITPLKYNNPTIEEVMERLHWTNTQPLWASENISKSNRFIG